MSKFVIHITTDIDMGPPAFKEGFLEGLVREVNPHLRAERFGFGEPVDREIRKEGLKTVLDEWAASQMAPMFSRATSPQYLLDLNWRAKKGKDAELFPWGCTLWLDAPATESDAIEFFRFLIGNLKPVFGYITSEEEDRRKHCVQFKTKHGLAEEFRGLSVGASLPGIYWVTFFGPWAISRLHRLNEQFHSRFDTEHFMDGVLIKAYQEFSTCGTRVGKARESEILKVLGQENFFKKPRVISGLFSRIG
jgi:hypothetical protein